MGLDPRERHPGDGWEGPRLRPKGPLAEKVWGLRLSQELGSVGAEVGWTLEVGAGIETRGGEGFAGLGAGSFGKRRTAEGLPGGNVTARQAGTGAARDRAETGGPRSCILSKDPATSPVPRA